MNQHSQPLTITAVIPAYNAGRYIERTLKSVLAQTRPADEIIVVDDGSTDDTAIKVKAFTEKVTYIYQDNAGASVARNTGIKAATSEWIALLDGDDEWLESYIEKQLLLLENNPTLVWTIGNFYRCLCNQDEKGVEVSPKKAQQFLNGQQYLVDYFGGYIAGVRGCTDTAVIKRKVLIEVGLFRVEQLQANDLDMWWRIAHRWPQVGYLVEPLAIYHMGEPGTISQDYFKLSLFTDLIGRHLTLSEKAGCRDSFRRFATFMLHKWMRSMLFEKRPQDIRCLLQEFGDLFSWPYKVMMRLLTAFPKITEKGCRGISFLMRLMKLKQKVVRKSK